MPVKKKTVPAKKKTETLRSAPKSPKKKVVPSLPVKKIQTKVARPVAKGEKKDREDQGQNEKKKNLQQQYALVRGMRDILPKDEDRWLSVQHAGEDIARAYGFGYIETPVVENANLFIRSVGKGSDIVDKEMYVFEDRDASKVALRPEGTASVCRAYINHGMHNQVQPVKLWYSGSMFRHERPQAGRYRQFHQIGYESFGVHDPVIDAELIAVGYNFFRDLGINVEVQMNSIGNHEDRQRYLVELTGFLRSRRGQLSEESKKRLLKNPLRVLDSKEPEDQAVLEDAPQILDWLSDDSKNFFMKTLEYLGEMSIPYVLNPRLVRGLDYYTDTVFEFYVPENSEASQSALGAGGRYNLLVEQLGGVPTPACGLALGVERIMIELEKQGKKQMLERKDLRKLPVFFAQLGEQARRRALYLIEEMRRESTTVHFNLSKTSLKGQLELASKLQATHTIIIGQKEVQDGTAIIRDMESGIQEIVDQRKLPHELKKLRRSDLISG